MTENEVRERAFAMPLTNPAYPRAPVANFPVLEVLSGVHRVSDLTLNLGTVVHDDLVS